MVVEHYHIVHIFRIRPGQRVPTARRQTDPAPKKGLSLPCIPCHLVHAKHRQPICIWDRAGIPNYFFYHHRAPFFIVQDAERKRRHEIDHFDSDSHASSYANHDVFVHAKKGCVCI